MNRCKIHRYIWLLTASVVLPTCVWLTSCSKVEVIDQHSQSRTEVPLALYSGISASVTRAFDSSWEANDQIGVFTVVAGSTDASSITYSGTYQDANLPYKITTGGETYIENSYSYMSFNPVDNTIYLPFDGSNVDVYAYYPYDNAATASGKTITLEATQTLAGQKGYDLLKASKTNVNIDAPSAQLLFQHCLTKVLIVVKAGTGYAAGDIVGHTAVKLTGTPTSATYMPLTQTLNNFSTTTDITPYQLLDSDPDYSKKGDGVLIYRALVMPNTATGGSSVTISGNEAGNVTRQIKLTIGTGTTAEYTYTIDPTNFPFTAGQVIKFTLELNPTGVVVTAAITPWLESSIVPDAPLEETTT